MATQLSTIETIARRTLMETSASFWTSAELIDITIAGVRDLWRDIVDLKEEHYLTVDTTNVTLQASSPTLSGVPSDVHKIYLIEPANTTTNTGLIFEPMDFNDPKCRAARSGSAIDPNNDIIYYSITSQGAPVGAPVIRVAPQVTSVVAISFAYVPAIGQLTANSVVPIPGEADNALVAWTIAYARAKEREDRSPDPNWIAIYSTEKTHLLESLGARQYQEPKFASAIFEDYWGG